MNLTIKQETRTSPYIIEAPGILKRFNTIDEMFDYIAVHFSNTDFISNREDLKIEINDLEEEIERLEDKLDTLKEEHHDMVQDFKMQIQERDETIVRQVEEINRLRAVLN